MAQYNQFKPEDQTYGYNQPVQQHPNTMAPQVVVAQPMAHFVTDTNEPVWTWCHLVTSVISLFCCQCFGIIAIVMSILSYVDHSVKSFERARGKRQCALGFGIAAIVIGSLLFLIVIIMAFVGAFEVTKTIQDLNNNNNINNPWNN